MKQYKAEDLGAFISPFGPMAEGAADGPLKGLTFAMKDLYDVKGQMTGCGSVRWAETHKPALKNSAALDLLLGAGATLMGKTHTDELAYSLLGMNPHYGTPLNPRAPDRIPGGSSNGSASACAGGVVDFTIGSDTGGSVRLPASFCGLFGMRPSHNRISLEGVMPLASSFDTAGWFARDAKTLERVGRVLLQSSNDDQPKIPSKIFMAMDAFELMNDGARAALMSIATTVANDLGSPEDVRLSEHGLTKWMEIFRVVQAREAWNNHCAWIEDAGTPTDWGVGARFNMGSKISDEDFTEGGAAREVITARMHELLGEDGIMITPTTPDIAPLKESSRDDFAAFRDQALSILCPAGLAQLPQITLPVTEFNGAPLGLSLVGSPGQDEYLLQTALSVAEKLKIVTCATPS
jgi:amidase